MNLRRLPSYSTSEKLLQKSYSRSLMCPEIRYEIDDASDFQEKKALLDSEIRYTNLS